MTLTQTGNNETCLVTAGTGKVGRRIVARLRQQNVSVRIGSRNNDPAFDWHDRSTWDAALDGVTAAYIAYLPDLVVPGAAEAIEAFVSTAVEKGVQRLVLLSGRGETEGYRCERIVQDSGVDWTIIRAGWFMQNFTEGDFQQMICDGAIVLPARDIPEPFVDVNDIADVAVAALTEEGHSNQLYEVTGPRAMTLMELANEISVASRREIPFIRVSMDALTQELAAAGTPGDVIELMRYLFGTVLDGRNSTPGDGVQRALGRAPADFRSFARRAVARGAWKQSAVA